MVDVCIAGMHRSGTSLITGTLHAAGLSLGALSRQMPPKPDNPDGFFEHLDFVAINDSLLAAFGGAWDLAPVLPFGWSNSEVLADARVRAMQLLETNFPNTTSVPGAWKDPRNSLTLPFWHSLRPDLRVIVCLRSPMAVARSLAKRNGNSVQFALELWKAYHRTLVRDLAQMPHIVTHYDSLLVDPTAELKRIADFIGLDLMPANLAQATARVRQQARSAGARDYVALERTADLELRALYDYFRAMAGPIYESLPEFQSHPATVTLRGAGTLPPTKSNPALAKESGLLGMADTLFEGRVERLMPRGASGWAWMPGNPSKSVRVVARANGQLVGVTSADHSREDLALAGKGTGRYGFILTFSETLTENARLQFFCGDGSEEFQLDHEHAERVEKPTEPPSNYSSAAELPEVTGHVDYLSRSMASGWAWIAAHPDLALRVQAVLQDKVIGETTAELMRPDLAQAGIGSGRYGFELAFREIVTGDSPPIIRVFAPVGRLPGGEVLPPPNSAEPVDLSHSETAFEAASSMLHRVDRDRIEKFREQPVSYVGLDSVVPLAALTVKPGSAVRVSIIVPVYGHKSLVRACLLSVYAGLDAADDVEVIVADDKWEDNCADLKSEFPGILYTCNEENLGFLKNCNQALRRASGQEVLLLNSDVQVPKGFLRNLLAALDSDPAIGIVGPKLIYPNGRLQEAGCAIRLDGSTIMIGVGDDPNVADYCYSRDVDYCSGACLLVRKRVFEDLGGGLDERYAPSYCEDVDLCLAARAAGWRVVYCAEVVATHQLSASHDGIGQHIKVERSMRNQEKLRQKWSDTLARMNRIRSIAFYLPQFHQIAENELWWGAGFTEWANIVKANPNFDGHYQPHLPADLGFYDLANPGIMREQAALAERYGVDGFCLYYYNFGGRKILETPLNNLRADQSIPFKFCLCWVNENWTKNWSGGERQVLLEQPHTLEAEHAVIEDVVQHLGDSRYIQIDGRPFFLVYRPLLLRDPKDFAMRLRTAAREMGIGEIVLGAVEGMDGRFDEVGAAWFGFDIAVELAPHVAGAGAAISIPGKVLNERFVGTVNGYGEGLRKLAERQRRYPRMRCVFPSWDNTARRQDDGVVFDGASPEAFEAHAEYVIRKTREHLVGDSRIFFINAWNGWAEGAHLEPDRRYGHRWLEAVRNARLRAGVTP